tara:strand:+ start:44 stop:712 length:669 start_codon:yes stop_codon:yes gene_type:complete
MILNSCFECESTKNLVQHHVVPKIVGGTKTITLCVDCHGKVHGKNLVKMTELIQESKRKILESGRRAFGKPPFGYMKDPDKYPKGRGDGQFLMIDEKAAEIVKYIFDKYYALSKKEYGGWKNKRYLTKTMRTQRLLKLLRKKGYKYYNKDFKTYHLQTILDNEFYIGNMFYEGKKIKHIYPTFMSTRLFNLCNKQKKRKSTWGKFQKNKYPKAEKINEDTTS